MKDKFTVGTIIGISLIVIALLVVSSLLTGFVGYLLWNWLAVSLFGATPITFWTAWGVCFAIGFLRRLIFPSNKKIDFKDFE